MADLGGIYSYNARFYSPTLGRFLSADTVEPAPSDPEQLNRYTYVLNNPINRIDPSGQSACWDEHKKDPGCNEITPTAKVLIKETIKKTKSTTKANTNTNTNTTNSN
jgi:RHS repeat-associated protein